MDSHKNKRSPTPSIIIFRDAWTQTDFFNEIVREIFAGSQKQFELAFTEAIIKETSLKYAQQNRDLAGSSQTPHRSQSDSKSIKHAEKNTAIPLKELYLQCVIDSFKDKPTSSCYRANTTTNSESNPGDNTTHILFSKLNHPDKLTMDPHRNKSCQTSPIFIFRDAWTQSDFIENCSQNISSTSSWYRGSSTANSESERGDTTQYILFSKLHCDKLTMGPHRNKKSPTPSLIIFRDQCTQTDSNENVSQNHSATYSNTESDCGDSTTLHVTLKNKKPKQKNSFHCIYLNPNYKK